MSQFRVFLVLDETAFFHPQFVHELVSATHDEIVGAAVVTRIPPKGDLDAYLRKNWRRLHVLEMAQLAREKLHRAYMSRPSFQRSVRAVLSHHDIPTLEIKDSINKTETIERISGFAPDVIVSSNSLYFGKRLLRIPRIACINRHSSLLPSYGGLWPVFHAVARGESQVGVSVHVMTPAMDRGRVLSRREVPITREDSLFSLYDKCFVESGPAVLEALEVLRSGAEELDRAHGEETYYSMPTADDWHAFRARDRQFIS